MSQIKFRYAQPDDIHDAVPLIYSSGIPEFDYGFSGVNSQAKSFLKYAFSDGRGFFGWRNHVVATANDVVIGIAAFYSGQEYLRLSTELVWQVFWFFSFKDIPRVLWCMHQLQSRMPKPSPKMHYIANFAVRADMRGNNIGSTLLLNQLTIAKNLGRTVFALDVSVDNPRAQALYERLGFKAVKINKFAGDKSKVTDTIRMEMPING